MTPLTHSVIDDQAFVRRYLQGNLPVPEQEAFEDHFVACQRCQEAIEWEEDLLTAFRAHANEAKTATQAQAIVVSGVFAWLARQSALRRGLLLFLGATIAVLPWLLWHGQRTQAAARLAAARNEARDWRAQFETARAEADAVSRGAAGLTPTEGGSIGGRADLPRANTPFYYLTAVRGDATAGAPIDRLPRPPVDRSVVLVMELDAAPEGAYRASLYRGPQRLWSEDGVMANVYGAFVVSVPEHFLPAGDYRLVVEDTGEESSGITGQFAFRIH